MLQSREIGNDLSLAIEAAVVRPLGIGLLIGKRLSLDFGLIELYGVHNLGLR